jgi:chromosome segregation ATPase
MTTHIEHIERQALRELDKILEHSPVFRRLEERVNQLMGAVDDIKASLGSLQTAVQRVSTDLSAISARIPAAGSGEVVSETDLASIKGDIDTAATALGSAVTAVEAVLNPQAPQGGN